MYWWSNAHAYFLKTASRLGYAVHVIQQCSLLHSYMYMPDTIRRCFVGLILQSIYDVAVRAARCLTAWCSNWATFDILPSFSVLTSVSIHLRYVHWECDGVYMYVQASTPSRGSWRLEFSAMFKVVRTWALQSRRLNSQCTTAGSAGWDVVRMLSQPTARARHVQE